MIFYFSGTGNSQMAAKQIAEIIGDEVISINQCLKNGKRETFRSEKPLVFVAPTYAWRIPKVVERWIFETHFKGSRDVYFVLTCGGSCGNAAAYAKKISQKKDLHFCGLAPVVMPENYVAMFPTPDEAECKDILKQAKDCIATLSVHIGNGEALPLPSVALTEKLQSGPVNQIFYPLFVHDKKFTVSDACVACGKCAKRCPLGNIEMVSNRPLWGGNCTHCMACIGGCPAKAIEYGSKTKGKHRYYIMED